MVDTVTYLKEMNLKSLNVTINGFGGKYFNLNPPFIRTEGSLERKISAESSCLAITDMSTTQSTLI